MTKQDYSLESTRELLLVANVVAVMSPASLEDLEIAISKKMSPISLKRALRYLIKERLIRQLPEGDYIATAKGLRLAGGSTLARRRDIERMFHILDKDKEGC